MKTDKFALHSAVYLILERDNKILLIRRYNTGWEDGKYTLPSGHLDGGETIKQSMIREAKEEVGIIIDEEDLTVVHAMHRNSNYEYIDYFLKAAKWQNEPENMEPDKADELIWVKYNDLPENTLTHIKNALRYCKSGIRFSEEGF